MYSVPTLLRKRSPPCTSRQSLSDRMGFEDLWRPFRLLLAQPPRCEPQQVVFQQPSHIPGLLITFHNSPHSCSQGGKPVRPIMREDVPLNEVRAIWPSITLISRTSDHNPSVTHSVGKNSALAQKFSFCFFLFLANNVLVACAFYPPARLGASRRIWA